MNRKAGTRTARVCLVFILLGAWGGGCGSNINELAFQAVDAAARTWIDLLLTDVANRLADAADAGQSMSQE